MTDLRQQQTAIRTVAEHHIDYAGWTQACALLDQLSDDAVRAHAGELEVELKAWPPQLRVAPPKWAARLRTEGQEPRVQLCRVLDLSRTTDRNELWRAIGAPDAALIETLGVSYCELDAETAPELARRLAQTQVRWLGLTSNPIGVGIAHVLRLSRDGLLARLDADSCGLDHGVLEAVVAEGGAFVLRELGLGDNHLTAQDLEHLARLPGLDGVRRLGLGGNKFLAPGVRVLAEQAPLAELRELNLEGTQCSDEGAAVIAAAPAFARLEVLSLMSCVVGDAGAAALAASTSLTALASLDLKFNRITAAGAGALLASAHLPSLARLELTHNEIGDEILGAVASSPLVTRLASLTLDDTYLSDEARAALQSLPLPAGVLDLWLMRED
jgi:Leucine Rich repeat